MTSSQPCGLGGSNSRRRSGCRWSCQNCSTGDCEGGAAFGSEEQRSGDGQRKKRLHKLSQGPHHSRVRSRFAPRNYRELPEEARGVIQPPRSTFQPVGSRTIGTSRTQFPEATRTVAAPSSSLTSLASLTG